MEVGCHLGLSKSAHFHIDRHTLGFCIGLIIRIIPLPSYDQKCFFNMAFVPIVRHFVFKILNLVEHCNFNKLIWFDLVKSFVSDSLSNAISAHSSYTYAVIAIFYCRSSTILDLWWRHNTASGNRLSWSNIVVNFQVDWFGNFCTSLTYERLATDRQTDRRTETDIVIRSPFPRGNGLNA